MKKAITHRDGTISYWSVYRQVYVERAAHVDDATLASMSSVDRDRVIRHLHLDTVDTDYDPDTESGRQISDRRALENWVSDQVENWEGDNEANCRSLLAAIAEQNLTYPYSTRDIDWDRAYARAMKILG